MKILKLTLKKQWFDMILKGEKKEEYREVKEFWVRRLIEIHDEMEFAVFQDLVSEARYHTKTHSNLDEMLEFYCSSFVEYDAVEFTNGYGKDKPQVTLECKGITIGQGNCKWGAPIEDVFVIKLGKEISRKNIHHSPLSA